MVWVDMNRSSSCSTCCTRKFPSRTWSKFFLRKICSKKTLSKLSRLHDQRLLRTNSNKTVVLELTSSYITATIGGVGLEVGNTLIQWLLSFHQRDIGSCSYHRDIQVVRLVIWVRCLKHILVDIRVYFCVLHDQRLVRTNSNKTVVLELTSSYITATIGGVGVHVHPYHDDQL
jgi:uncharacterized protein (UPF0333 family)